MGLALFLEHHQQLWHSHSANFLLLCFIGIPVLNVNCINPDQIPYSAVSDLGLHCLPIVLLGFPDKDGLNRYSSF